MSRLVLGLGSSVDHEVDLDLAVLERLAVDLGVGAEDLDVHARIDTERDLVRVLLGFLRTGTGGERAVGSDAVVWGFSNRFAVRETVGGTPVRAADALARLGAGSLVHLSGCDPVTLGRVPAGCRVITGSSSTTVHPHLIVQFDAGARITLGTTTLEAPYANRVILVHDPVNAGLELSPALPDALEDADVLLLSGLNAIADPAHARDLTGRLVAMIIERLPSGSLVVYEDAGFHQPDLGVAVASTLAPVLGVHSMNEDEMQAYTGREVDLFDAAAVGRALDDLRSSMTARTLVVHTKAWVAAVGPDPYAWRASLAGGAALATARYARGDAFGSQDHAHFLASPALPALAALAADVEAAVAGPACVVPTQALALARATTVGLGDTFVAGFIGARADPVRPAAAAPRRLGQDTPQPAR